MIKLTEINKSMFPLVTGNGRDSRLCDNLNREHLDYFYWLPVGVGVLGIAVYAYLTKSNKYEENAPRKNYKVYFEEILDLTFQPEDPKH